MTTFTFDTHKLVKILENKGFNAEQVEGIVGIMQEAQNGSGLATKHDLAETELKLVKWMVSMGVLQTSIIAALMMKLTG